MVLRDCHGPFGARNDNSGTLFRSDGQSSGAFAPLLVSPRLLSAAAAAARSAAVAPLRIEGADGEVHPAEQLAGVLLAALVVAALARGHAVAAALDGQLRAALEPHSRKLPDRHIQPPRAAREHELLAERLGNGGRDLRQLRLAAAAVADLADLRGQDHRVEGLDDTDGEAVLQQAVRRGQRVRARERLCLAAPAVERNALCEDRKAGDGDGARSADGRIAEDAVVERQVDRIVPALIGQRLDLHAREQQLGAAGLGAGGAVERRLRLAGEIDAQILHAVLIHAAVQNLIGMNADTCIAGLLKGFVWHTITSRKNQGNTAQFSKSIRRRLKGNYAVLPQLKAEYSRAGPLLPHSMRGGKKCARRTARRE